MTQISLPPISDLERRRLVALYHFIRLQLPEIILNRQTFDAEINRTFSVFLAKAETTAKLMSWAKYLEGFYSLDWAVAIGCLQKQEAAWDTLFAARTGRSDALLIDALRMRANRLYPRKIEQQETAVAEFWSHLISADSEGSSPVLARYDGRRPIAPWLIRVFQNRHLSKLRVHNPHVALPDDELALPVPGRTADEIRWHEIFIEAAKEWLDSLDDEDRLLLGLRWRYKLSQRDAAKIFAVHEGTLTRRTDKLRDRALEMIGEKLIASGWTGEELESLILTELGGVLADDSRLSANQLAKMLNAKGMTIPV